MPNRWPAHLMFLSLLWQNGGEPYAEDGSKATFDSQARASTALTWMARGGREGYSPANVAQDSQYVAFKNGEDVGHLGRHLADQRPQGGQDPVRTWRRSRPSAQTKAVWANSHNFFITRQARRTTTSSRRPRSSSTG